MEKDICTDGCWRCPMGKDMTILYPECYKKLKEMGEDDIQRKDAAAGTVDGE